MDRGSLSLDTKLGLAGPGFSYVDDCDPLFDDSLSHILCLYRALSLSLSLSLISSPLSLFISDSSFTFILGLAHSHSHSFTHERLW